VLAAIDDEIVFEALGPVSTRQAHCFEISTSPPAAQLYELMAGHDRYVADLRSLLGS